MLAISILPASLLWKSSHTHTLPPTYMASFCERLTIFSQLYLLQCLESYSTEQRQLNSGYTTEDCDTPPPTRLIAKGSSGRGGAPCALHTLDEMLLGPMPCKPFAGCHGFLTIPQQSLIYYVNVPYSTFGGVISNVTKEKPFMQVRCNGNVICI